MQAPLLKFQILIPLILDHMNKADDVCNEPMLDIDTSSNYYDENIPLLLSDVTHSGDVIDAIENGEF